MRGVSVIGRAAAAAAGRRRSSEWCSSRKNNLVDQIGIYGTYGIYANQIKHSTKLHTHSLPPTTITTASTSWINRSSSLASAAPFASSHRKHRRLIAAAVTSFTFATLITTATPATSSSSPSAASDLTSHQSQAPTTVAATVSLPQCPIKEARQIPADRQNEAALVVVLGWLGSQDKHLAKYADIYRSSGREVIAYNPTPFTVFAPEMGRAEVDKLLADINSRVGNGRPVIFHAMSNNGAYHLAFLMAELRKKDNKHTKIIPSLCGVAFDSAPSELNIDIFTRGFSSFILGAAGAGGSGNYNHPIVSPLVRGIFSTILSIPYYGRTVGELSTSIEQLSSPSYSQLFLYSKGDDLIPADHIMRFADLQWKRTTSANALLTSSLPHQWSLGNAGVKLSVAALHAPSASFSTALQSGVSPLQWRAHFPSSEHVAHGRHFPKEYRQVCLSFLDDSERRWHALQSNKVAATTTAVAPASSHQLLLHNNRK